MMDEISRMLVAKTRKDNISKSLLFPCLRIDDKLVHQFPEFGFVNTYLTWDSRNFGFPVIYLMFKTDFTLPFYYFIQQMEKNINFLETIDVPKAVIVAYRVPKEFEGDYHKFLNGRYSQTSREFKSCFPMSKYVIDKKTGSPKRENNKYVKEHTNFYHIFNRTKELRERWLDALGEDIDLPEDIELYDKCDLDKETLKL